jgi:hypothetical protein
VLEIHRLEEGIIGMREVTISCSILGCAVIVLEFSTKLGNSSQSSVNIPGAPPEVTQQLVILTLREVKKHSVFSLLGYSEFLEGSRVSGVSRGSALKMNACIASSILSIS